MTTPLSLQDPLTKVYSRATLATRLQEEIDRAQRYQKTLGVLLLDLDYFKSVNDAFGHARGDQVLVEFAHRLQNIIRDSDLIFRFGGDEFVILLPNTSPSQAEQMGRRLLATINSTPFSGTPPLTISLSLGIACFPDDGVTPAALFEVADQRHYIAKRTGRGCVVSKTPPAEQETLFFEPDRLIEREGAIQKLIFFLQALEKHSRGLLWVWGPAGVGKSGFLDEARRIANLHGYLTMNLAGDPSLKTRVFGVLNEGLPGEGLPSPWEGIDIFSAALQARIAAKGSPGWMLIVERAKDFDQASLKFIHNLFYTPLLSRVILVHGSNEARPALGLPKEASFQAEIYLAPLTKAGLHVWTRNTLHWEPPADFTDWLYQQTAGLPGKAQRVILHLLETGLLKPAWQGFQPAPQLYSHSLWDFQPTEGPQIRHNLPGDLPVFVGRRQELQTLKEHLIRERLVTLVGPGGIGKTRLAIQAAAERLDHFPDGVFFIPLREIEKPDLVPTAIAKALDLPFSGPDLPLKQVIHALRKKRLLLILDNFEQLQNSLPLVVALREQLPELTLLVTSREKLNLPAEDCIYLQGLGIPAADEEGRVIRYPAVQLFIQNARHSQQNFAITEETRRPIVRICRTLEGLPLGLELAAAWVSNYSCAEIADRIENNQSFLETPPLSPALPHRSLLAIINSFWDLLLEPEHSILRKLSVFRGGFTEQAAREVAGASSFFLQALAQKAYLRRSATGRFHVHELLQQFASQQLEKHPGEKFQAHDTHCTYFTTLLHQQIPLIDGDTHKQALDTINAEIDNIRAAWQWGATRRKLAELDQGLEALCRFYATRGWFLEADDVLSQALAAIEENAKAGPDSEAIQRIYGRLLIQKGCFSYHLGNYGQGEVFLRRSLELLRPLNARPDQAMALDYLASNLRAEGEYDAALELVNESLKLAREVGDLPHQAEALNHLGIIAYQTQAFEDARNYFKQALAIHQQQDDAGKIGGALNNLGNAALALGEFKEAKAHLNESLALVQNIGAYPLMGSILDTLGKIATAQGQYQEAQAHFLRGIRAALEAQAAPLLLEILVSLAYLRASMGQPEQAIRLLALPLKHPATVHAPRERARKLASELGIPLPPDILAITPRVGEQITLSQAIQIVLTPSLDQENIEEPSQALT